MEKTEIQLRVIKSRLNGLNREFTRNISIINNLKLAIDAIEAENCVLTDIINRLSE